MEEKKGVKNIKLRQARELEGWTQKEVADTIDLPDARTLRRWENGEASPSLRYRAKLCKAFDKSPEELGFIPQSYIHTMEKEEPRFENTSTSDATYSTTSDKLQLSISFSGLSPLPQSKNRQRLLERVRTFWIEQVLEQSLQKGGHITLGLQVRPDAVANTWNQIRPPLKQPRHVLRPGTTIIQAYDDALGELLILGEPGAGKTTLLLELTRDLLQRAFQNEDHQIPVVFHLSSWKMEQQSLMSWLIDELSSKYQVPRRVGQDWIENGQILPLLDGLDEIHPAFCKSCVEAINDYRDEHGWLPLVVCSRTDEYIQMKTPLVLCRAVCIQPLTQQQVDDYLTQADDHLKTLRLVLENDARLQSLVSTPLMLSILISTYQNTSPEYLHTLASNDTQRQQIFAMYVEQMLTRQRKGESYSPEQTKNWLIYLACQMKQHYQVDFYFERIQVDWLPSDRLQQLWHGLLVGIWVGIFSAGLLSPITIPLSGLITGLVIVPLLALTIGFIAGIGGALLANLLPAPFLRVCIEITTWILVVGCVSLTGNKVVSLTIGLVIGLVILMLNIINMRIEPTEAITWSWMAMRRNFVTTLMKGALIGGGFGLVCGLVAWFVKGPAISLVVFLISIIVFSLLAWLRSGFSNDTLDEHYFDRPNQGIKRSITYAMWNGLLTGIVNLWILLVIGAGIIKLFPHVVTQPDLIFFWGIAFLFATVFGTSMHRGGEAYMKHMLLRCILCAKGYTPWNYVRFLDYSSQCILLRKVGGGYTFVHQLMLEYFASLTEPDTGLSDVDTKRV